MPDLQQSSFIVALGDEIERALKELPYTFERAWAAMHFCYNIQGSKDTLRAADENLVRAREASMRASLSEFASIEEGLQHDLRLRNRSEPPLRISDTDDPLLHIVKELRNLEIHLHPSKLAAHDIVVYWRYHDEPETHRSMTTDAWCVDPLTVERFAQLRNARFYSQEGIQRLVEWFNEAQQVWGVIELIRLAILRFARLIIDKYGLGAANGAPQASRAGV